MKKIKMSWIMIVALCLLSGGVMAQSYSPQAGDKSVSLRFGRAVSFGDLSYTEINRGTSSYSSLELPAISAPSSSRFSTQNDMTNMIGVEVKYFLSSQLALRFSGAGAITGSPSQDAVSGIDDATGEHYPGSYLPGWKMVEGRTTNQFYIDLGADYYFASKYARVNPYAGAQINSTYGQMEIFDGFRGLNNDGEVIPTYDTRRGEAYALGGSLVGGVDYYLSEGFILGIEIKAVNYMYNVKRVFHQSGMEAQEADTHNIHFLSQPVIKLGFRF
jgi:outer membrane protein W